MNCSSSMSEAVWVNFLAVCCSLKSVWMDLCTTPSRDPSLPLSSVISMKLPELPASSICFTRSITLDSFALGLGDDAIS